MTVDLYANEVVINAGDTIQMVKDSKISGKLIVTNQRIYFKTINSEESTHNLEILPEDILEIIYFGNGIFSTKGLNVVTSNGNCLSFPLKKRDEIGKLINAMY